MTQRERILRHFKDNGSITTFDAYTWYGITRLPSRICDLRKQGYKIRSERETAKNRYGEKVSYCRYSLEENNEQIS